MIPSPLIATTKAKLNLSLIVKGRREDGMHMLHSHVVFCDIGDRLEIAPADTLFANVSGRFAAGLEHSDNLILKAARLLQTYGNHSKGAALTLEKNLPVASGMGGGSGDAALTLRLLNQLWEESLDEASLTSLAAALGADVPVCLEGRSCIMQGIGEDITLTPLAHSYYAVLVNPLIPLATPQVFAALPASVLTRPLQETEHLCSETMIDRMCNDLQQAAMHLCPVIGEILQVMRYQRQTITARMTGSGATCFALCANQEDAEIVQTALHAYFPHFWVASGIVC